MITIKPCITDKEIVSTYPAISELYDFDQDTFLRYVQEMQQGEYSLFGAFEDNNCVGAVGHRIGRRLYCGKYLHIDNLIVREAYRRKNIAKQIIDFCKQIVLCSVYYIWVITGEMEL